MMATCYLPTNFAPLKKKCRHAPVCFGCINLLTCFYGMKIMHSEFEQLLIRDKLLRDPKPFGCFSFSFLVFMSKDWTKLHRNVSVLVSTREF